MSTFDSSDYDGETELEENEEKEAKYQKLSEGYEFTLEAFLDEELLIMLDYFIDGFTALGDYKDSAEKAEECRKKLEEIQEMFQKEEAENLLKSEASPVERKCEELKSQIAALTETIKKDAEKIAEQKNKLSKIDLKGSESILKNKKRFQTASPILLICGLVLMVIEFVLISLGKLETILPGILCGLVGFTLFVVWLVIYFRQRKNSGDRAEQASAEAARLSSALDEAMKDLEKHKNELESKQGELECYLLGL